MSCQNISYTHNDAKVVEWITINNLKHTAGNKCIKKSVGNTKLTNVLRVILQANDVEIFAISHTWTYN